MNSDTFQYLPDVFRPPIVVRNDHGEMIIPGFIPEESLVRKINKALQSKWPLLVTGEETRRSYVSRSVGFNLFGEEVIDKICYIHIRPDVPFQDYLFTYDHESRLRDITYYQADPEHNKIRKPEFYLKKGALLEALEYMTENRSHIILDFMNIHDANEEFLLELTSFFHETRFGFKVEIPEVDYVLETPPNLSPFVFLTGESGYQVPVSYVGVIHNHEMAFPPPQILAEEISLIFMGVHTKEKDLLYEVVDPNAIKELIMKHVDLFYRVREHRMMNPEKAGAPMPLLDLINSIDYLIRDLAGGKKTLEDLHQEIDTILSSQESLDSAISISELIKVIRTDIEHNRLQSAFSFLKALAAKLDVDEQNQISILTSTFHEIDQAEKNQLEVPYFLIPRKNSLKHSILSFLQELEPESV